MGEEFGRAALRPSSGAGLDYYSKLFPRTSPLPISKEKELFERYLGGEKELEERLVRQYAWMGVVFAYRYAAAHGAQDVDGLVGAALEGVLKGVRRVDPKRPNRAGTYITYWIKQSVVKESRRMRGIRLPDRHYQDPEQVSRGQVYYMSDWSSVETVRRGDEAATPLGRLVREEGRESLMAAIQTLPPRYRSIIENRCGLNEEGKVHTLDQIAQRLSISRERVRQLETKAKRHIEKALSKEYK